MRSARAGLIFPVGKVHRSLKRSCGGKRVMVPAAVYCSAVLEYLTAEVMELAGSACKELKMKTISPRHMQLAIRGDEELSSFIKGQIAGGGVVPHVHQFLESGKKKKKNFGDDSAHPDFGTNYSENK